MVNTAAPLRYLTAQQYAADRQLPDSWVYAQCRLYIRTRGRQGLCCKKFGRYTLMPSNSDEKSSTLGRVLA